MHALVLLSASMLWGGCTINNRYRPELLSPTVLQQGNQGVVVLSAGAWDKCIILSTFLKVLAADQQYNGREYALLGVDAYPIKSDFNDHHGFLHAIALPAGRYYISPWLAHPQYIPERVPKFEFSVTAGEMTYLGEYFLEYSCSSGVLGGFRDQSSRDLPLLKARRPDLDINRLRVQLPVYGGLAIGKEEQN
jgi:hypothetical protein